MRLSAIRRSAIRPGAVRAIGICLAASLALAACDRSDPPSDKMRDAVSRSVETVAGRTEPPLADGRYAPRDGCADVEGYSQFRSALRSAVEARDADALARLAAPGIRLDFGGGGGRDTLTEQLRAADAKLWTELDALLELGCARQDEGIVLPWYFAQSLVADDPYSAMLVTGESVPLHRAAAAGSETLEPISWDVVELVDGLAADAPFQHVVARSGTAGYVASEDLRSLLDYRLLADRLDGEWRITALVRGD